MYLNCYEHCPRNINYVAENKYDVKEFINSNFVEMFNFRLQLLPSFSWIVN
jgi:hypothetical protein